MRKILVVVALFALTLVLLACGGATEAEPQVIREVVTQVVEVTVEGEDRVVTQVVEQEVERVVTATPSAEEAAQMEEDEAAANLVTLDIPVTGEPPSLDPSLATDTTSVNVITNIMCGLGRFDENANVEPWVAKDWTVSEDGRTYTFNLRDDVSWVAYNPQSGEVEQVEVEDADGNMAARMVTAQDFAYGIMRTLDPATASEYAYVLYFIDGAEAFNTADPAAEDFETLREGLGVNVVDDQTLEITFVDPIGYGPSIASMWITYAQPEENIAEWGEGWTEAGRMWNCGAFALDEWVHNAQLGLTKNPFYFNADEVQIDRINAPIIQEESTAMSLYEAGDLDFTAAPIADLDRIRSDPELSEQLNVEPTTCTYYYGFVTQKDGPVNNPAVRKALSAAIDRTSLIENVTKGGQIPAHSFAPPGIFGNVADNMEIGSWMVMEDYGEQLAQAQTWMEEAGYANGAGLDILLMHNTSEAHAQIAQAVQAMWQQAFPEANFILENQEWGTYLQTLSPDAPIEEKPDVYRLGWCADYPDQSNWMSVFVPESGNNSAMYNNEEFAALVEQASVEQDPATRQELYAQAETLLVDTDAAIAPIYYYTTVNMQKPYMTNVVIAPAGGNPWYLWSLDADAKREMMGQ